MAYKLLIANAFNLNQSKILLFGKRLFWISQLHVHVAQIIEENWRVKNIGKSIKQLLNLSPFPTVVLKDIFIFFFFFFFGGGGEILV